MPTCKASVKICETIKSCRKWKLLQLNFMCINGNKIRLKW